MTVINTPYARDLLRKRYAQPEWVLVEEVAPNTGGGTRYADAVAVNLWNSRGHAIHGFEIKVSRADWLKELKQPEKAESVFSFCDHWWIVAPKEIIKDGELPTSWGLLDLTESGLRVKMEAPRLQPRSVTRGFFASLVRRSFENISAIAEQMNKAAMIEARTSMQKENDAELNRRSKELLTLKASLKVFEEETGLTINRYSGPPIEVIRLAQQLQCLNSYGGESFSRLTWMAEELLKAAETIRNAIGNIENPS